MRISDLGHPPRTGEMAGMHSFSPHRFGGRIDLEENDDSLAPVGPFILGIEQTEIVGQVVIIIRRQSRCIGRLIVKSAFGHGAPRSHSMW